MNFPTKISNVYTTIFSDRNIHRIERIVVMLALFGFLVHLLLYNYFIRFDEKKIEARG